MNRFMVFVFFSFALLNGGVFAQASECTESTEVKNKRAEAERLFEQRSGSEDGVWNLSEASRILKTLEHQMAECATFEDIDSTDILHFTNVVLRYAEIKESFYYFSQGRYGFDLYEELSEDATWASMMANTDLREGWRELAETEDIVFTEEESEKISLFASSMHYYSAILHFFFIREIQAQDPISNEGIVAEKKEVLKSHMSALEASPYSDIYYQGGLRLKARLLALEIEELSDYSNPETEEVSETAALKLQLSEQLVAVVEKLFTSTGGEVGVSLSAHERNNQFYIEGLINYAEVLDDREEVEKAAEYHMRAARTIHTFLITPPQGINPSRVPEINLVKVLYLGGV